MGPPSCPQPVQCLGFGIWKLGCWVWGLGLGCGVWGVRFSAWIELGSLWARSGVHHGVDRVPHDSRTREAALVLREEKVF